MDYQTKRNIVIEWIKKQDLTICCLQETHVSFNGLLKVKELKVKRWKK